MDDDKLKKKLRMYINKFELWNNLFDLAEAARLLERIMKKEGFSLEEYVKYKNK